MEVTNFNPMIALKAGIDSSQAMVENYRKAQAYNALSQMYGPQVGNLDWQQAQSAYGAQQKLPGELESQRQTNAFNEIMNPLKIQKQQGDIAQLGLQNDYDRQTMGSRVEEQNLKPATARLMQRKTEIGNQKDEAALSDDQAERERNAAQGIIAAVKPRIEAGEDPGKVFDEVAPQIAAHENVDPGKMAALRRGFIANPRGIIQATEDSINAVRPNAALARTQNQERALALKERELALKERKANPPVTESAVASLEAKNGVLDRAFDSLIGTDDRPGLSEEATSSPMTRGLHNLTKKVTGTTFSETENEYRAAIDTVTANLGLDVLRGLKAQGVGLGSVTEAEHRLMQASAGLADAAESRNPRRVREALIALRQTHREAWAAVMADLKARPGGVEALQAVQGRSGQSGGGSAAQPQKTLQQEGDDWLAKYPKR